MIVCCTLDLHRGSDESLRAESSAIYIHIIISILQYIEESYREDSSTQIFIKIFQVYQVNQQINNRTSTNTQLVPILAMPTHCVLSQTSA